MKAKIAVFMNHKGKEERRLYFPTWEVDGCTLKGVNVFPHRCDPAVCEYGDHVHIGVYDDPVRIVDDEYATLSPEQSAVITDYLRAQLAVDRLIYTFEDLITDRVAQRHHGQGGAQ